jgi:flagellar protein FlaF
MVNAAARYQKASEADDANSPPREFEISALGIVNRMLGEADERRLSKALAKNHELWSLLVKDLARTGNALPTELKSRLMSLGAWSMDYSIKASCSGLPVAPLVEVNRNVADGLRAQIAARAAPPAPRSAAPLTMAISVQA